jgi:hypothetical protein
MKEILKYLHSLGRVWNEEGEDGRRMVGNDQGCCMHVWKYHSESP